MVMVEYNVPRYYFWNQEYLLWLKELIEPFFVEVVDHAVTKNVVKNIQCYMVDIILDDVLIKQVQNIFV
jgi:hypothetical protein